MKSLSAQQIVTGCNRRDSRALGWIVNEYKSEIYQLVDELTNRSEDTVDLVSDSFARLVENAGDFNKVRQIRFFLFSTAKNICLDHLKRKQLREERAGDLAYHYQLINDDRMEEAEAIAACRARIRQLADQLPSKRRQVFRLYFFEEFSNSEIASRLKVSEKTVANHKARAIKYIKSEIRSKGDRSSMSALLFLLP